VNPTKSTSIRAASLAAAVRASPGQQVGTRSHPHGTYKTHVALLISALHTIALTLFKSPRPGPSLSCAFHVACNTSRKWSPVAASLFSHGSRARSLSEIRDCTMYGWTVGWALPSLSLFAGHDASSTSSFVWSFSPLPLSISARRRQAAVASHYGAAC